MTGTCQRSPIPFVIYWSEKVRDFSPSDLVVQNGIITRFVEIQSAFSSTAKYGFDVLPATLVSDLVISVRERSVSDYAGNVNGVSRSFTFPHDAEPILVSLDSSATEPAVTSPVPME